MVYLSPFIGKAPNDVSGLCHDTHPPASFVIRRRSSATITKWTTRASQERFDLELPNFTRTSVQVWSTTTQDKTSLDSSGRKLSLKLYGFIMTLAFAKGCPSVKKNMFLLKCVMTCTNWKGSSWMFFFLKTARLYEIGWPIVNRYVYAICGEPDVAGDVVSGGNERNYRWLGDGQFWRC